MYLYEWQSLRGLVLSSLVFALFLTAFLMPQSMAQSLQTQDEVLITISKDRALQARDVIGSGIRFYHRFPDRYLAGATARSLLKLRALGFAPVVVDDRAWSDQYAIVAPFRTPPPSQKYAEVPVVHLQTIGADDLVKGSREDFARLRSLGYSCVEVTRAEIPLADVATYFPPEVLSRPNDNIVQILSTVSDSIVRSTIQGLQNFGTRYCTNANRDSVFRWVRNRFLAAGVTDVVMDSFLYSGTWQKNVIATIPGTVNPTAEIIIGGHLDSYSSNLSQAPGADDNATGTTAAIEMARAIIASGYQPAVTMRFIGFAAEEVGLKGSIDYALKARQANRNIKVMQNYDMIGYRTQSQPDRDFYLVWYTGSEAFSNLHALMAQMYTALTPVLTTSYRSGSDSYSFWQQNYNTVFAIERDFSPYYHTPNDLLQYLDIPYCSEIIKSGLAMALTLDALPPSVLNLRVRDRGNGTSLLVQWDSLMVPDLLRYKVYIGTSSGSYTSSSLETVRTKLVTGLTSGTRYFIGVSMVDLAGREGPIIELSSIPRSVPLSPANLEATSISDGILLTWRRNQEVDLRGYYLYRANPGELSFTRVNATPSVDTLWSDSPLTGGTYRYFVTATDSSANESTPSDTIPATPTVVGVGHNPADLPAEFSLEQNYPNPFNPKTNFQFSIGNFQLVNLKIFDLLGREVATLINRELKAGSYEVTFDASNLSSGIYLAVLQSGSMREAKRMVLIR